MDPARYQQTLNFNFNNVPVRFNLSSTQPLPENVVVNTVRSLVRNASTAIGYSPTTLGVASDNTQHSTDDSSASASGHTQAPLIPNSTSIPMWNQNDRNSPAQASQEFNGDPLQSNAPLLPVTTDDRTSNEQGSRSEQNSIPTIPANETQGNNRPVNTNELITNLAPHIINALRVLIVLFGKHLSGYFLDLGLCIVLIFSCFRAEETVKRVAFSEQTLSWRNLRSVMNNLLIVVSGLGLVIWLYSTSQIFWLFAFQYSPEEWIFGNFITTATMVVMINYFVKCSVVALKLTICLATRCNAQCLPLMPNVLTFLDVFGHLYLCLVVVGFWFVYVMRADGNFGVGVAIFTVYIVSRVPYFFALSKDCLMTSFRLISCRSHGRRATAAEVEQSLECAICQDGFRSPTVVSCKHVFCNNCINRWLVENRSCPVCRQNLTSDSELKVARGLFFI